MASLAYAITPTTPPTVVDLAAKPERERLSGPALQGFFALAERWRLKDEEARALLGGPAASTFYEMKRAPGGRVLDQDRLTRISYLIGIFKALHILHGEALADSWVKLPNSNRIFGGATPLATMIRGGLPAMLVARRLLDARRGGM